jgi:hypothetical protein
MTKPRRLKPALLAPRERIGFAFNPHREIPKRA